MHRNGVGSGFVTRSTSMKMRVKKFLHIAQLVTQYVVDLEGLSADRLISRMHEACRLFFWHLLDMYVSCVTRRRCSQVSAFSARFIHRFCLYLPISF